MTELNLEKAKSNRKLRENALYEYNKISEAINKFNDEGFVFFTKVRTCGHEDWQEIYPDAKEFQKMLLNMRDRYDLEISTLDKEFAEL